MKKWIVTAILVFIICIPNLANANASVDDSLSQDYIKEELKRGTQEQINALDINEWNNFKKPQLMVQDIAVDAWQLFDWRSMRNVESNLAELPKEKITMVYFSEEVLHKFSLEDYKEHIMHASENITMDLQLPNVCAVNFCAILRI